MMEKKDLIQSGMIERYILGELSSQEEMVVKNAIAKDTEVRSYFNTLEDQFEQLASDNAIKPMASTKKALLNAITTNEKEYAKKLGSNRISFYVAASVAFICALGFGLLYMQNAAVESQLVSLEKSLEILEQKALTLEEKNLEKEELLEKFNNPNTSRLVLRGNDLLPEATAIAYINHKEKTVLVDTKDLPSLTDKEDYQLWSDVDGEMIDMGVMPKDQEISAMAYIADASSLNITIEPAGGSDHPTVSRLISNVYLR